MKSKYSADLKKDGTQRMVARLIYMEPALWDEIERVGKWESRSRSSEARIRIKRSLNTTTPELAKVVDFQEGIE